MRDPVIATVNHHGAGFYGYPAPTHVTRCVNSRNSAGHSAECPCWRRADRIVAGLAGAITDEGRLREWLANR